MTSRRAFLAGLAAAAVPLPSWADAGSPAWLACAMEPDGGFALFGLALDGSDTFRLPLPTRGHAGAAHPSRPEAVVFARRPGGWALEFHMSSRPARGRTFRKEKLPYSFLKK